MLSRLPLWMVAWVANLMLVTTAQAVERFRLEAPGDPTLTSMATLSGEFLDVRDAAGQRTVYRYRPELDSPDGRLRGFYNSALRQAMRWPVAGGGPFEIGSFVGSEMRWRQSRMVIVPEELAGPPSRFGADNPEILSPNAPSTFDPNNPRAFAPTSPNAFDPLAPQGFNPPNRSFTLPPQGPRLVRRTARPGAVLAPAAVELINSQREELALRIADLSDPRRTLEFSIPPGRSVVQRFERDAGGEVEEVTMVPDATGQYYEDVRIRKTPPQPRYEISIFARRVVSEFFDRTQSRSTTPDEVSRGLTPIGTLRLPPGDLLRDGEQIDIFRRASRQAPPGQAQGISP